jgi:acyl-CoA thioesterase-2
VAVTGGRVAGGPLSGLTGQTAPVDFADMMRLSSPESGPDNGPDARPDTFEAVGPRYPWGGLYGGQIVAQALRAAAATVDPAFGVHSLHAYFIRRGDHTASVRFEVDRLRNGRSFVTRSVVASQAPGAILHMSASFTTSGPTERIQTATPPDVPDPDQLTEDSWSPLFDRRMVEVEVDHGRAVAWLRLRGGPTADPVVAACALAFLSDELATDAVRSLRQRDEADDTRRWNGISLDHALWFQAPLTAGDWQLYDFRCDGLVAPRGLALGHVFDRAGAHLATATQEVLLRPVSPAGG